jgi:hypothetical protein
MTDELWAFVCETRTGRVVKKNLPFSGVPRMGKRINTEGPLTITLPMNKSFQATDVWPLLTPWFYSYGVAFGPEIIQCGPLTAFPEYDSEAESWSLDCCGMLGIFNRKRYLVFTRDYTGKSRCDVAISVLADDMAQINGDLPIDLPALDGLGGVGGLYPWAKFTSVGEVLKDQTDDRNGVEIEMKPYFTDTRQRNYVRWNTKIGAPYLGDQTTPKSWVQNRSLLWMEPIGGGDRIADLYIVPGQTSGDVFLFGVADPASGPDALAKQGWPLLTDLDTSHTSESNQATLTAFADGNYLAFHRGYRMVRARVRTFPKTGFGPRLNEWTLGDVGAFRTVGNIGMPDGTYTCRIIGAEPATLEDLDLELQVLYEETS